MRGSRRFPQRAMAWNASRRWLISRCSGPCWKRRFPGGTARVAETVRSCPDAQGSDPSGHAFAVRRAEPAIRHNGSRLPLSVPKRALQHATSKLRCVNQKIRLKLMILCIFPVGIGQRQTAASLGNGRSARNPGVQNEPSQQAGDRSAGRQAPADQDRTLQGEIGHLQEPIFERLDRHEKWLFGFNGYSLTISAAH